MTEAIKKAAEVTKHSVWKYFGAAFMEQKDGEWAVSLHKMLGSILFAFAVYLWMTTKEAPDSMLYTLWGLLGINGLNKLLQGFVEGKKK